MSKVSRQKLKSVVKECLVEILKEGITTQGSVSENSRLTESNSMQVSRMITFHMVLELILHLPKTQNLTRRYRIRLII